MPSELDAPAGLAGDSSPSRPDPRVDRGGDGTALGHLVTAIATASPDDTVGEVRALLVGTRYQSLAAVYLVEGDRRLAGTVPLERLMAADGVGVMAALAEHVAPVAPGDDQEHVANRAVAAGLAEVPVVDEAGRLLGAVTAASLVAILRHEHIEDLHRLAGIRANGERAARALSAAPLERIWRRLPWLLVGFVGAAVASFVMTRYKDELSAVVAVAFFVPGIVYLADAIGTQSEAVAVRGLSFNHSPIARLIGGELLAGLGIGAALGALAFPAIWAAFGDLRLAATVALAILFSGACAASIGLLLPWLLERLGWDPAFGSGPVATVIQDILSMLVYFSLASALLF